MEGGLRERGLWGRQPWLSGSLGLRLRALGVRGITTCPLTGWGWHQRPAGAARQSCGPAAPRGRALSAQQSSHHLPGQRRGSKVEDYPCPLLRGQRSSPSSLPPQSLLDWVILDSRFRLCVLERPPSSCWGLCLRIHLNTVLTISPQNWNKVTSTCYANIHPPSQRCQNHTKVPRGQEEVDFMGTWAYRSLVHCLGQAGFTQLYFTL